MQCPYCFMGIRFDIEGQNIYQLEDQSDKCLGIGLIHGFCPECHNLIVLLKYGVYKWIEDQAELIEVNKEVILYPTSSPKSIDSSIPQHYRDDYNEAYSVLSLSPKSSAALCRRILQKILTEEYKIVKKDLYSEITEFLNLPNIPSDVLSAVDAIRNIGNFAAHPLKFQTTGDIVDVEPGEAEWLLEVIEALFDITFVLPKKEQERKDKLNKKLADLGKPPSR